jgi:ATP-dependent DNA helicase RecG
VVAARRPVAVRSFAGAGELSRADLLGAPVHWPRPSVLDASIQALDGVGPKLAAAAAEAGIATVGDVLRRFPHSHRDRAVQLLSAVEVGQQATILVDVLGSKPRPFRKGRISLTSVKVGDESGHIRATWFNQPWVANKLEPGARFLLTGKRTDKGFGVNEWELVSAGGGEGEGPRTDALARPQDPPPRQDPRPTSFIPVHPATEALKAQKIRDWAEQSCRWVGNAIEGLPAEMRVRRRLPGVADAIRAAHFPESREEADEALARIGFEELFLYQAILATRKRSHRTARPAPRLGQPGEGVGRWVESLPFEPTGDQLRAFDVIDAGKTVVALYSMLRALEAGYQAALMAPTEVLAEQHAITLGRLLAAEATPFALVTGSTPAATRRRALDQLASGELGLILGTHALLEDDVRFARLGLCVVDEQHRFGVAQRRALDSKGIEGMAPHILHMTATPIPRTLSLTAYGDLDTTALHQLPRGRKPVETWLVEEGQRAEAYDFLRARLREGRQAFVVCPLVEQSEKMPGKAAEDEAARLRGGELREFGVGVLHGQMPSARKAEAMAAFAAGETDVLVATTVIEVGIDVPNATVMVIEGAERFGVSQLHQLRGRVGRGEHASQCLLFADARKGGMAQRRLTAVAKERDGFKLAEVDLSLRGEGEILGTRQSGLPRFAVAELPEDTPTLVAARDEVLELLRRYGSLADPALGPLLDAAHRRFGAGAADPIPL